MLVHIGDPVVIPGSGVVDLISDNPVGNIIAVVIGHGPRVIPHSRFALRRRGVEGIVADSLYRRVHRKQVRIRRSEIIEQDHGKGDAVVFAVLR